VDSDPDPQHCILGSSKKAYSKSAFSNFFNHETLKKHTYMPIQVGASCKISATFPTPVGGGQERLSFSTFLRIQPGADSEIPKNTAKQFLINI